MPRTGCLAAWLACALLAGHAVAADTGSSTPDAACVAAEVVPDQDFRPSHTDITQGRTWLDPEYNNNRMVQAWSSLEGEIFVGRFNLDITLIDESVRTLHGGPARADALSQPDVGEFIGGTVVSFGAGGRAYMALRQGEEWPVVQLVDQETGASDFDWVWPSASPNAASYMFLYQRNQEFRLAEVTDFRTGAYVDWGSLGFRNVDGASTPGGIQSLASPRFVPGSRRVVSPVVADHATGRTEIRLYGFPDTRPEEGVLPFVVLELSIFDEVNAFRAAGWPGSTVLVSHSADQRSWEFRLLDHTLPIGEVDGANLPIVHRVTNPNPEIWGTSIRNSEPIEIGDRSFFMFISKEDGRPTPGTLGVNHLWIAEIAQGETWVRKVDDIPAGGNDLFVTDPEWSGGGEVLTAFDREGHLYAFPTGITRVACETPPGRHPRRRLRPVVGVSLQPTAATVAVGGTQAFAATVTGTANQAVDWSVQEGPSGGTISSVGLYVAPAEVGTFHIVATSVGDPNKSAAATVTVLGSGSQFTPSETVVGDPSSGCLGLEFSPDMKWLVWTQQGVTKASWLCSVNPDTGDFVPANGRPNGQNGQPFPIPNIPPRGNPQWGRDSTGWFIIAIADDGRLVHVRPGTLGADGHWLVDPVITYPAVAVIATRQYPFAARLPERAASYVIYEQLANGTGAAGVYWVDLGDPTFTEHLVTAPAGYTIPPTLQNIAATIYRWFPGLPIFTCAIVKQPGGAVKMGQLDVSAPTPTPVAINPATDNVAFHTDDFPSVDLGRRTLIGGVTSSTTARYYLQDPVTNETSALADITVTPAMSALSNPQWATSFEPFEWNGRIYSAFQIIDGADPLKAVPSEVWLTSLSDALLQTDTSLLRRINTATSLQRRDPEYFLGTTRAWIYYYAKPSGTLFTIYRAETGLPERS